MTVTYVDEIDSGVFTIQKGNRASPEVFTTQCVANTNKSLSRKATTVATVIARCDDTTQPGKTVRTTTATDTVLSYAGTFTAAAGLAFFNSVGQKDNYKIFAGTTTGYLTVAGPFILEDFTITGGELGKVVDATFTLSQADEVTATGHG